MKLYNRTRCPDSILKPLLSAAGRAVGARTGGVVVKVTQARTWGCSGQAWDWTAVRRGWLTGNRNHQRWIETDRGAILIRLPLVRPTHDPLERAERVYRVALHEWQHVKDYQRGRRDNYSSRRRPRWRDRPCERRAMAATSDALEREAAGELASREVEILALALWFEEQGAQCVAR